MFENIFVVVVLKMTSQKYEKMTRGEIDNMHTKIFTDITIFVQLCHGLFFHLYVTAEI